MTAPHPIVDLLRCPGDRPLDQYREDLLNRWWAGTLRHPQLGNDDRWMRIGGDIASGRSLKKWVSNTEEDPWDLPTDAPGEFLDALDALVEDEAGADLQHMTWDDDDGEG